MNLEAKHDPWQCGDQDNTVEHHHAFLNRVVSLRGDDALNPMRIQEESQEKSVELKHLRWTHVVPTNSIDSSPFVPLRVRRLQTLTEWGVILGPTLGRIEYMPWRQIRQTPVRKFSTGRTLDPLNRIRDAIYLNTIRTTWFHTIRNAVVHAREDNRREKKRNYHHDGLKIVRDGDRIETSQTI